MSSFYLVTTEQQVLYCIISYILMSRRKNRKKIFLQALAVEIFFLSFLCDIGMHEFGWSEEEPGLASWYLLVLFTWLEDDLEK